MKIKTIAILFCILAMIPAVIAEDLVKPSEETTLKEEIKVAPTPQSRRVPDFKSMTRTVTVSPSGKKTLTRANFHEATRAIAECRKGCITEQRNCQRTCTGRSTACNKACKNSSNKCYDNCALSIVRR